MTFFDRLGSWLVALRYWLHQWWPPSLRADFQTVWSTWLCAEEHLREAELEIERLQWLVEAASPELLKVRNEYLLDQARHWRRVALAARLELEAYQAMEGWLNRESRLYDQEAG